MQIKRKICFFSFALLALLVTLAQLGVGFAGKVLDFCPWDTISFAGFLLAVGIVSAVLNFPKKT